MFYRVVREMGIVERQAGMQNLQDPPRPGRSRDLFGVQLEVSDRVPILLSFVVYSRKIRDISGQRLLFQFILSDLQVYYLFQFNWKLYKTFVKESVLFSILPRLAWKSFIY